MGGKTLPCIENSILWSSSLSSSSPLSSFPSHCFGPKDLTPAFLSLFPQNQIQTRSFHTTQALFARNKRGKAQHGYNNQTKSKPRTQKEEDYYKVLGLEKVATEKEIRRSYLKLAKQNHPDHNPGNDHAERTFKLVTEAHAVLSDPKRRAMYDKHGKEGFSEEESHRDGLTSMFGGDKFEELVGDPGPIFESVGGADSDEEWELDKVDEDQGMLKRKEELLEKLVASEDKEESDKLHKELKELRAAIRKDYVDRAKAAADIDQQKRDKKQKEADDRIDSIVESLLFRLSVYQPTVSTVAPGAISFEEQTKKRAAEIVQSPGGIGMLEMVGEMYLLEARRNFTFSDDFLGLNRAKAYGAVVSNKFSMVTGLLTRGFRLKKMMKEIEKENEGKKDSDKRNEEFVAKNQGTVVEALWMHGKLQFSGRLQRTLRQVLLDKNIDYEEKKRRAEGIRIIGNIFLEVVEETKKDRRFSDSPLNWQTNAKDPGK